MNCKQIEMNVRQSRISALKSLNGASRSARPSAFYLKRSVGQAHWPEPVAAVEDRLFTTFKTMCYFV
ncbi:hypothetical protein [Neptunicoccus sediminis]|uniref:hypothetical protein n=1 Tax=Neptunicoccus sediminis TaxID=1892596 RepID=UPI000845FE09|nr:hypothetical protein [Neptunicoccus sediminis]